MRKLWKLWIALCFLLCIAIRSLVPLPTFLWVILINLALTYIISLFLSYDVIARRRFGAAFLIFAGVTYAVPALTGFDQSGALIEVGLWNKLIDPYVLVSIYETGRLDAGISPERRAYDFVPEWPHYMFSCVALATSIIAIIGAVLFAKRNRIGEWIWVLLLLISTLSFVGYVYVALIEWGIKEIAPQICWEVLYVVAFLMVIWGERVAPSRILSSPDEW